MNSPVGVGAPLLSDGHLPNYVFVADKRQQSVYGTNLISPQLLLHQDSKPVDLYQAHLTSASSYNLHNLSRNLNESLVEVILEVADGQCAELIRFRDNNGHWRMGQLECLSLQGTEQNSELVCGVMSMVQLPNKVFGGYQQEPNRLVWIADFDLQLVNIGADCQSLGFDPNQLLNQGQMSFLSEETKQFLASVSREMFAKNDSHTRVVRQSLKSFDGTAIAATIQFTLLFSESGEALGVLGLAEFFPSREMLESERQLFSAVFESISDGIFVTDRSGFILKANPAFFRVSGYRPEKILGAHCSVLWHSHYGPEFFRKICHSLSCEKNWRGEINFQRADGNSRPGILSFSHTQNSKNQIQHYVGMVMDIAEKKKSEQKIHRLAYYDSLTGVTNRRLFNEKLRIAVHDAELANKSVALLFLDLDRFKPVNDSLGHNAGDQLLKGVAGRLQYCLRDGDTVSRMGGDEFAILLQGLEFDLIEQSAIKMASRIQAQFVAPFLIDSREVYTSASIGIALFPYHGQTGEVLLRSADTAMYAAKRAGKNNYQFYNEIMNKRAMDRLIMENALRKALINESFELYYQPQYCVYTRSITGIEVLLRWNHPVFGSVRPVEFIDLAEQTDLIIPLGDWVFQQTCKKISQWKTSGICLERVSINVSVHQFKRPDFAEWVLFQLQRYQLEPSCLELEVTESALMEDVERSLNILTKLKESNIRIAVDDFGTGYSSLQYLREFPLDTLKIDRVFIEDMVEIESTRQLTQTIIAIAKSLKLTVIAEGVETWEQHHLLQGMDCDEVQGYFLSQALTEEGLLKLIKHTEGV